MQMEAISNYAIKIYRNSLCHCEIIIKKYWQKLMKNAAIKYPIKIQLREESDSEHECEESEN